MASLRLEYVGKSFAGHIAVQGLDLNVPQGRRIAVLGPSGSGKTTLLRLIAGLESLTHGRIWIDEQDVTALGPSLRQVGLVSQESVLYPHLSVTENLAFPLQMQRRPQAEVADAVQQVATELGVLGLLARRPDSLSGGERQRIALGRALIRQPQILLLDEPFTHLDPQLRVELRSDIVQLLERHGTTTLLVTHDQQEALAVGQDIAVIRDGVLQQYSTPTELLETPCNRFVAQFVGTPGRLLLRVGVSVDPEGRLLLVHSALSRELDAARAGPLEWPAPWRPSLDAHAGYHVWLAIRPNDLHATFVAQNDVSSSYGMKFTARVLEASPIWGGLQLLALRLDTGEVAHLAVDRSFVAKEATVRFDLLAAEVFADDVDGSLLIRRGAIL